MSKPHFDCMDWQQEGAVIIVKGDPFEVHISPYSPGVKATSSLVVVSSLDELTLEDISH